MAQIANKSIKRTHTSTADPKKVAVPPPLAGRYSRHEGAGNGPEHRHNGTKRK
jgi:hypothetical protein